MPVGRGDMRSYSVGRAQIVHVRIAGGGSAGRGGSRQALQREPARVPGEGGRPK
jgi:hypothetical protein